MALKVGELYASFGIDSSGIGSAISGIEKKCSGIASSLTKTGAVLSATVMAPIIAFAKETYNIGTEFQAQMSRVQGISGATATELAQLTQTAKDLGASSTFSASQAAEGMEYLASAGFNVTEIIAAMPGMLDLAASSGEDLGTSADIAASILRGFGMEASEAAHVADVLAKNAANTNAAVYDTGEAMKFVAPLANTMGLSFEEVTAAIGLMANAGIKGSQAGTTLRGALSRLAKPTKVMQETMDELNLSFYDSAGKMKSLPDMISMLQMSMSGLTEEQQQNALVTLFGQEALSGMMVLLEAGPEALAEMAAAYENCDGAASEMAEIMLNNLKGAMEGFNGAVETAQLNLYDRFAPAMTEAVQKATELVNSFNLLDDATKETVYKVVSLAAAAGPAMMGLGGIIGAAGKLLPLMGALVSPLGIVTAGIALFGVAAVDAGNDIGKGFVKLSKSMKKSLSDINKNLSNQIKTVSKRIPALASSISEGLGEIMPVGMESAMTIITGFVSTIADNASDLAGIGLTIVTNIVDGVAAGLPKLIPAGAQMVTNIATSLISNLPNLLSALGGLAMSIWDSLHDVNWSELGGQIWNAITSAFKQTGDWVKQAVLGEKYTPEAGWDAVGAAIWASIKSGIKAKGDWIKQTVLGESYTADAGWDVVGSAIWAKIQTGIKATGDWLAGLILPEGTTFEAGTGWSAIGKSIWEAIKGGISATGDWLAALIMPANTTFSAGDGWKTIGSSIWTAIQGGISATGDWLAALIMPANTTFTAGTGWSTIGKAIWNAIQSGISATGDWVKALVLGASYTADAGWNIVGSAIWGKIASGISVAGDWVKGLILGATYTADAGWNIVGSAIWTKIQTGVSATGDWVKGLVLGSEYTADASWSTVGSAIWAKIQTGITATGDWIKGLILGNAFTADSDWTGVGEKIVSMISSGLKSLDFTAETMAANLTSLGNFVQTFVKNMLENRVDVGTSITTFVTNLVSDISSFNGWATLATTFGSIATSIINGIVSAIPTVTAGATNFINAIGSMLSSPATAEFVTAATNVATNIIGSIVQGIPKVVDGAKSIVGAIGNLLSTVDWSLALDSVTAIGESLLNAIVAAIGGIGDFGESVVGAIGTALSNINWEKVTVSLDGFVTMLSNGISEGIAKASDAVSNIVTAIGDWLGQINWEDFADSAKQIGSTLINGMVKGISAALQGASQIADAIADLFQSIDWEAAGTAAGDLAASLLTGIVEGLAQITPDMTEFCAALGRGIDASLGAIGDFAGHLIGKLIAALFSADNWIKLVKAGGLIVEGLLEGILNLGASILGGAYDLISNFVEGILVELDVIDSVDERVSSAIDKLTNLESFEVPKNLLVPEGRVWLGEAITAWRYVTENGSAELIAQYQEFSWLANEQVVSAFDILTETTNSATEKAAAIIALQDLGLGHLVDNAMAGMDETMVRCINQMVEYLSSGDGAVLLQSTLESLGLQIPQTVKDGIAQGLTIAEAYAAAAGESTASSYAEGQKSGEEGVKDAVGNVVEVAENVYSELPDLTPILGEDASNGLGTGIKNGETVVTDAMAEVSNAAVEAFLKEMSYDTGYELGQEYTKGIQQGASSQKAAVTAVMATVASSIKNTVSAIMSNSVGHGIGYQFSSGIAAGIRAGIGLIQSAAAAAAAAAVGGSQSELDINSPSRVAKKEVGWMYDEGIAVGLLDRIPIIRKAASDVAASMHDDFMVGDPSHGTVYSSGKTVRQAAKETAAQSSEDKSLLERARTMGIAIAEELINSGALEGDVIVDGEKAGRKVSGAVSRKISRDSKKTVTGRTGKAVLA